MKMLNEHLKNFIRYEIKISWNRMCLWSSVVFVLHANWLQMITNWLHIFDEIWISSTMALCIARAVFFLFIYKILLFLQNFLHYVELFYAKISTPQQMTIPGFLFILLVASKASTHNIHVQSDRLYRQTYIYEHQYVIMRNNVVSIYYN